MSGAEAAGTRRRPIVVAATAIAAAAILATGLAGISRHQRPDDRDNMTARRAIDTRHAASSCAF
jgi:hypothetical protein